MKLIKKGRPQKAWSRLQTCTGKGNGDGGCGATLHVEATDLFRTGRHPYDGSHVYFVTFTCMSCGVFTDITSYPGDINTLPAGIGG